jgi:hypothetical protein
LLVIFSVQAQEGETPQPTLTESAPLADMPLATEPPDQIPEETVESPLPTKGQLLTTPTPVFKWTAVTGTGSARWMLEIARDAQMTQKVYSSPTSMPATATSFTLPAANGLTPGLYYWRVYRVTEDTSTI